MKRHDFIAKQQSLYLTQRKESLLDNEYIVMTDFAENYSFVLQDAVQGFHWNNAQATVHPFVCYYRRLGVINHISFVIISDCLNHDTVAVHLYQKHLISFLTNQFGHSPVRMIYFSDGASSHYKNCKNFANLCHHESDFNGIKAEWHFFATSHGKGPCDGVGGTVKRSAARASLQKPYNDQIMTPRQLFEYSKENVAGVHFHYCTNEEYNSEGTLLEARFNSANTIVGTRGLHAFKPISLNQLEVKVYSTCAEARIVCVDTASQDNLILENIKGFVTLVYNNKWYLAVTLQTFPDTEEVKVSCLEPAGPARSFVYPQTQDILVIPASDVLTLVDPLTSSTARCYRLSDTESLKASRALQLRLSS